MEQEFIRQRIVQGDVFDGRASCECLWVFIYAQRSGKSLKGFKQSVKMITLEMPSDSILEDKDTVGNGLEVLSSY
jgi:hypothetical protein